MYASRPVIEGTNLDVNLRQAVNHFEFNDTLVSKKVGLDDAIYLDLFVECSVALSLFFLSLLLPRPLSMDCCCGFPYFPSSLPSF